MFDKLMSQMGPMKEAMDQSKKKLETIIVKGEAESGLIAVYMNGNRKVTDIKIDASLIENGDNEALEELLQVAMNKAIESASNVNEMEMASAARSMMPGMF